MNYLRINGDMFGFINDQIHKILETDIPISDEDYDEFFKIQSTGEQFRLKETRENPSSLFDCVETYQPEITESPATMSELSAQLQSLLLKASQIEQQINQQMEG